MMSWQRLAVLCGVLLLGTLYFYPTACYACDCAAPPPPREALENSYAVFSGKVIAIEEPPQGQMMSTSDPVTVTFEVKESWKGNFDGTATVKTPMASVSCGFSFIEGEQYLVYAHGDEHAIEVSLCSRTLLLAGADQDLLELGPGIVNPDYGNMEVRQNSEAGQQKGLLFLATVIGLILVITFIVWIRIRTERTK